MKTKFLWIIESGPGRQHMFIRTPFINQVVINFNILILLIIGSNFSHITFTSHTVHSHTWAIIIGATIKRPIPAVYSETEGCTDAPVALSPKASVVSSPVCIVP